VTAQLGGGLGGAILASAGQSHRRPCFHQRGDDGAAQPAITAGDQGHAAVKPE
jgi:hypothetical protein